MHLGWGKPRTCAGNTAIHIKGHTQRYQQTELKIPLEQSHLKGPTGKAISAIATSLPSVACLVCSSGCLALTESGHNTRALSLAVCVFKRPGDPGSCYISCGMQEQPFYLGLLPVCKSHRYCSSCGLCSLMVERVFFTLGTGLTELLLTQMN